MRIFALAACATILAACASVPLATAIHLASMDQRTLAELDPSQVRVRLAVPVGFDWNVPQTRLVLEFSDSSGKRELHEFHLVLLQRTAGTRPGGHFRRDIPVTITELALDPLSIQQLRTVQQSVRNRKLKDFRFSVSWQFAAIPEGIRSIRFWVDLRLRATEDYMRLVDGAEIRITYTGN